MRYRLLAAALACCLTGPGLPAQSTANPLNPLSFLVGRWRVPPGDSALARNPGLAGLDIIEFRWIVGGQAILLREMIPRLHPDIAGLEGTV
jgi:hypothetical protein